MRNPQQIKAAIARSKGLATPELIRTAAPGAVYLAEDRAIALPNERLGGTRTTHVHRWVIVFQSASTCNALDPKTVLIIPCSASSRAGMCDLALPSTETVFDKPTVAFATLLQPILKSELFEYKGVLTDDTLVALQALVARNLGLIGQGQVSR